MTEATRRILVPANTEQRDDLEVALRRDGWLPLVYENPSDAQEALSRAPASAVILHHSGGVTESELVGSIRRYAPDAFVIGVGDILPPGCDTQLREGSSPQEVTVAVRIGAAIRDLRAAERVLREQLHAVENQNKEQMDRIHELEAQCSTLQAWARSAQELAVRDELTGLYNRRYFMQTAENEIERSRRANARFAMAMIDIDHFKHYNDTFGHVTGDRILKHFSRVLVRALRRMDTVARYGGEEFILLLPDTQDGTFDPVRLIDRLRQAIQRDSFLNSEQTKDAPITISAGVVMYPVDGANVPDLILEVDARLFRAKEAGRNRVCAEPDGESGKRRHTE